MTPTDVDRIPPHDLTAEQCVLGAMMMSTAALADVIEIVNARDFYRPGHQTIYDRIIDLYGSGEPTDTVTVKNRLASTGELARVGDAPYLHTLIATVPTAAHAGYYAKIVQEKATLRRLVEAGTRIVQLGSGTDGTDAPAAVEHAQKILDDATPATAAQSARSVAELIIPYMEQLESGESSRGVTTGWADIDAILHRLRPGQLIVLGARPGIGKTAAMVDLAHHVGVKDGLPVYVNTLEMATKEFMDRLVAYDAKINLSHLVEPRLLDDSDRLRLSQAIGRMGATDTLIIDDDPQMGVTRVRTALRNMRRAGTPAALVCIDYLQLMESPGKKAESRQVEISQISRSLKLLAKEFEVPIVVGAQLNRNVEYRAEKRPVKADLRESGSIEQDADVVILLHREDAYDKESPRSGEIDLIIDKNRQGPTGTVTLAFQGHYSRIVDMAKPEWTPTRGLS